MTIEKPAVEKKQEYKPSGVFIMGGLGDSRITNSEVGNQFSKIRQFSIDDITPKNESLNPGFSFEDRVNIIVEEVERYKKSYPNDEIILSGQSAGGLAVLKAAEILYDRGIIVDKILTNNPAVPYPIIPLSLPLLTKMIRPEYLKNMLPFFEKGIINISEEDYAFIIQSAKEDDIDPLVLKELADERVPISGKEAAQLAGFPLGKQPKIDFTKIKGKVVMSSGQYDRWVNPKAHIKLAELMQNVLGNRFIHILDQDVGHMGSNTFSVGSESEIVRGAIEKLLE